MIPSSHRAGQSRITLKGVGLRSSIISQSPVDRVNGKFATLGSSGNAGPNKDSRRLPGFGDPSAKISEFSENFEVAGKCRSTSGLLSPTLVILTKAS
jgi:hypothetical protein